MHLMAQLEEQTALQITAKHAAFSGAQQRAVVYGVDAKIMQAARRTWFVSATQGVVDRITGDLTVQGRVRLYEKDGYAIETDRLHLRTAERVLHTEEPVVMRGNAVSIAGTGLRHEIDENRIVLQHHVKASFRYAGGPRAVKAIPLGAHVDADRDRSVGAGAALREPKSDTIAVD
jgi:LPS export ABC transporter protein LptC